MIIKKFQAGTETEAIMLAKDELGKDAIVTNIKTVKPKGLYRFFKKPTVEVTAVVDDNENYGNDKMLARIKEIQQKSVTEAAVENKAPEVKKEEVKTTAIEERLNNLQALLESQLKNKEKEEEKQDENKEDSEEPLRNTNITCLQLIYNQLIRNEVDEKYANQVISEIEKSLSKEAALDNVLASVYQKLVLKIGQPKTIHLEEGKAKFIFFIGPTGVGKTTTIAKIASSLKLKKKAKVALITSDTYRIAAVEQLKTYANILGLPLKVVYTGEEIEEAKKEFADYDVVLVDTAGRSHKNREQRDDMEKLLLSVPEEEKETYLVLSATTKYNDLIKISETYKDLADYSLIFTKLDETSCIGNLFNIHMYTGAPLSYYTWGQNVPDDIGRIEAQDIAKQLLGGND